MWEILEGKCQDLLGSIDQESVNVCITDPPYGLGKQPPMEEVLKLWLSGKEYVPKGGGFNDLSWDGFVPSPMVWKSIYSALKPGALCVVFAGHRTFDLMALSMRLAGFEFRDSLVFMGWLYGNGFPKGIDLEDGYNTALKPSYEPILVMRKPSPLGITETFRTHQTGVLQIEDCRNNGRWPSNVLICHHPCCDEKKCDPLCVVHDVDAMSDYHKGRAYVGGSGSKFILADLGGKPAVKGFNDEGYASRYFNQFYYTPKASRAERDLGCDGVKTKTVDEVLGRVEGSRGLGNPRAGAGRGSGTLKNHHMTVKPISLMRWLVKLFSKPKDVILDPFAGSGSTLISAILEDRDILGVEQDASYVEVAKARCEFWSDYARAK